MGHISETLQTFTLRPIYLRLLEITQPTIKEENDRFAMHSKVIFERLGIIIPSAKNIQIHYSQI